MAAQLDPAQQFAYRTMDRGYLAEVLNEHIGRHHLDDKLFEWDDERLTDAVCQAAADSMGAIEPDDSTVAAEGDALGAWIHQFFNTKPVELQPLDYILGIVARMPMAERAKLHQEILLLKEPDNASVLSVRSENQHRFTGDGNSPVGVDHAAER